MTFFNSALGGTGEDLKGEKKIVGCMYIFICKCHPLVCIRQSSFYVQVTTLAEVFIARAAKACMYVHQF